jgi:hypothetical protein
MIGPTSARIVADIVDWPRVLGVIVVAKGCVVHGEAVRSGHRYQRLDGKGPMKSHMKSHGRVATFRGRPVHADAMMAFNALTQTQEQALITVIETASTVEEYLSLQRENDGAIRTEEGDVDVDFLSDDI